MPLSVDVVTAERVIYSEEGVDEVIVPGIEGELGVLSRHAPLLTMIESGVMRIKKGGEETDVAITGGFLEVRDNRVTILADAAERAEDIDAMKAEEARRQAERALEEREEEVDRATLEAALAHALAQLKVVERLRRRRGARSGPPGP